MTHLRASLLALALASSFTTPAPAGDPAPGHQATLEGFVESYRSDPMAIDATFGIRIGEDDWWHVTSRRAQEAYAVGKQGQYTFHNYGPHEVTLHPGPPEQPTWYYHFADDATFDKIRSGEWTAGTAAAKSTSADVVALNIRDQDGFERDQGAVARQYLVMEHFWKTEPGEVTRFSRDQSLPSHGAQLVSLYMMKDKRIGWFSLGPQEAANDDRGLERSQVPNLFIITRGTGEVEMDEGTVALEPGMSVFVGPYVKHVLRNTGDVPLEGILVLYGDNIDYAQGQSYLDFLDAEYTFYSQNERLLRAERVSQSD